jgi:hypothetical protein
VCEMPKLQCVSIPAEQRKQSILLITTQKSLGGWSSRLRKSRCEEMNCARPSDTTLPRTYDVKQVLPNRPGLRLPSLPSAILGTHRHPNSLSASQHRPWRQFLYPDSKTTFAKCPRTSPSATSCWTQPSQWLSTSKSEMTTCSLPR